MRLFLFVFSEIAMNTKVGAMISKLNMRKLQAIHDATMEMGAVCGDGEEKSAKKFDVTKMYEMNPVEYAMHEGWDTQTCCSVISQVIGMAQGEIAEGELDEAGTLARIALALLDHCKGEIQEMLDSIAQAPLKSETVPAQVKTYLPEPSGLDLSYIKSIGVDFPESRLAVKYVSKNTIAHPVFIWGDAKKTDLEREYFTPQSDFWDEALKNFDRPLTWEHGQDERFNNFEENPVIGKTVKFYDDEIARWAESVITTDKQYRKYIDQFIEEKRLGYSSDSAPQYVIRERQGKATWLKAWPWFGGSLTSAPCEPRMKVLTPEFVKSLGIVMPDAETWTHEMAMLDFYKLKYK